MQFIPRDASLGSRLGPMNTKYPPATCHDNHYALDMKQNDYLFILKTDLVLKMFHYGDYLIAMSRLVFQSKPNTIEKATFFLKVDRMETKKETYTWMLLIY